MVYDHNSTTLLSVAKRAPKIVKNDAIIQTPTNRNAGRIGREIVRTDFLEGLPGRRHAIEKIKVCIDSGGDSAEYPGPVVWDLLFYEENTSALR
jgi:hypothetical protein